MAMLDHPASRSLAMRMPQSAHAAGKTGTETGNDLGSRRHIDAPAHTLAPLDLFSKGT